MAGAYCRFCGFRCFVLRVMPTDSRWKPGEQVHLATCAEGMAYDREHSDYDHATAINPTATEPEQMDATQTLHPHHNGGSCWTPAACAALKAVAELRRAAVRLDDHELSVRLDLIESALKGEEV